MSFNAAQARCSPAPNLPKKPQMTTMHPDSRRPSLPSSPMSFESRPPSRVRPAPPSGNKRRADNVRDAEQALPRSPAEELNRQKTLALLEEVRQIVKQEKLARQKLAREHELVRKEEARKVARAKKLQHAWQVLDSLEHHDMETIHMELLRARRAARQEYLEQWTTNHVRDLVGPIMRRLNKVATKISAVDSDLTQLLGGMQEFRHNLLPRAQSTARQFEFIKNAGSVDPILRETGYKMSDIATVLLPVSTLQHIARDLKRRELWKTDVTIPTDNTIPDFFKGAKTLRVRRAMVGILWLRHDLIEGAAVIAQELHLLRKIRTSYLLNSGVPEVFNFNARQTRFYLLSIELVNNTARILAHYHHLRLMISQSSPFSQRAKSVHHPRHQFLPLKLQVVSQEAHHLFKAKFPAPMASGMRVDLALQEAQLSNFRPVTLFISRLSIIAELVDDVRRSGQLGLSSATVQALATLADELFAARRELYNLLDLAMLWRGTADMLLGIIHRPSQKSPLMLFIDPPASITALPRPSGKCPMAPTEYTPPWQKQGQLYPHPDSGIPIHFVTSPETAPIILRRLSRCQVLGIDTVTMAGSKGIPTGSSPVEYLVIASDREVAIFALGLMNPATVMLSRPFRSTLGNPAILKVGVNVGFQRNVLEEHFGIELVEDFALNTNYERLHRRGSLDDPNFAILSSIVTQSFGSALPHLDLTRAIREVGTKDPCAFFTHLSSRAYAALQLYRLACRELQTSTTAEMARPSCPAAAFGPVEIRSLGKVRSSRDRLLVARSPPLKQSRAAYLLDLAYAMARRTFETSPCFNELKRVSRRKRPAFVEDVLSSLQAYFLFTSFGQHLNSLANFGIRHPASTILRIAEKAQLSLHREDRIYLDMVKRREPVGPSPGLLLQASSTTQSETELVVPTDSGSSEATGAVPKTADRISQDRVAEIIKLVKKSPAPPKDKELLYTTKESTLSYPAHSAHSASKETLTTERNLEYDKVGTFYRSLTSANTTSTEKDDEEAQADSALGDLPHAADQPEVHDVQVNISRDSKSRSERRNAAGRSGTSVTRSRKAAQDDRRTKGWWAG